MKRPILSHPHAARAFWRAGAFGLPLAVVGLMFAQTFLLGATPVLDSPRERISLNADWRFKPGDTQDAVGKLDYAKIKDWVLPSGAGFLKDPPTALKKRPDGNPGGDISCTQIAFDATAPWG